METTHGNILRSWEADGTLIGQLRRRLLSRYHDTVMNYIIGRLMERVQFYGLAPMEPTTSYKTLPMGWKTPQEVPHGASNGSFAIPWAVSMGRKLSHWTQSMGHITPHEFSHGESRGTDSVPC